MVDFSVDLNMKKKYDIGSKMQNVVARSTVWLHNPHRTKRLSKVTKKFRKVHTL